MAKGVHLGSAALPLARVVVDEGAGRRDGMIDRLRDLEGLRITALGDEGDVPMHIGVHRTSEAKRRVRPGLLHVRPVGLADPIVPSSCSLVTAFSPGGIGVPSATRAGKVPLVEGLLTRVTASAKILEDIIGVGERLPNLEARKRWDPLVSRGWTEGRR